MMLHSQHRGSGYTHTLDTCCWHQSLSNKAQPWLHEMLAEAVVELLSDPQKYFSQNGVKTLFKSKKDTQVIQNYVG